MCGREGGRTNKLSAAERASQSAINFLKMYRYKPVFRIIFIMAIWHVISPPPLTRGHQHQTTSRHFFVSIDCPITVHHLFHDPILVSSKCRRYRINVFYTLLLNLCVVCSGPSTPSHKNRKIEQGQSNHAFDALCIAGTTIISGGTPCEIVVQRESQVRPRPKTGSNRTLLLLTTTTMSCPQRRHQKGFPLAERQIPRCC